MKVLKVLQALVTCDQGADGQGLIGQALVPYYRQVLPVLNIFIRHNGEGDKSSSCPVELLRPESISLHQRRHHAPMSHTRGARITPALAEHE